LGDLVASLDGRFQRTVVDDLGAKALAGGRLRQQHIDIAVARQGQIKLAPAPDPRPADHLAPVEQLELAEAPEAPLEQAPCLPAPFLLAIESIDDRDQPPVALLGGGHHAVARLLDEPGLEAVDADIEGYQRIAVDEAVLAVIELLLGKDRILLR